MVRDVLETHWGAFPHDFIEIGWIDSKFELLKLGFAETMFSGFWWVPIVDYVTNFL